MRKYFLLLVLVAICYTSSIVVGGFREVDKQAKQYNKIVSFIKDSIPILKKWNVESLKQQIVNGVNYVAFLSYTGNIAEVTVYSTFSGKTKLRSFKLNSQLQPIPQQKQNYNQNASNNTDGSITNNIVYDFYRQTHPLIEDRLFLGGYQSIPLNDSSQNQSWNQITTLYPYIKNYTILQIRRQIVAGTNFIFITQSQPKDKVIVVKVYQSLSHNFKVNILQINTAVGVMTSQVIAFNNKCIQLKPDLADYQITLIQKSDKQGLKLVYSNSDIKTVNCIKENSKEVIFL